MKSKYATLFVMAVIVVMMSVVVGYGQVADICIDNPLVAPNTDVNSPTTKFARIGVASNFWGPDTTKYASISGSPALSMVSTFLQGQNGTAVTVCHNSTATLINNISNYDMLLGADTSVDAHSQTTDNNFLPFTYASGIPVFFKVNTTGASVGDLITGLTGISKTLDQNNLSSYEVNY